ncbi:hypothetical protein U0Y62_23540 [Enterobacter hormaechei]|uniref:hypothetical protein n=1 Tax=Enterobacter hormaechei TaxID=158836 RepID=UPI0039C35FCE
MSELTKEWLLKTIAELEEERDATPGVVNEDAAMALAAMKLALASLEADPVAEVCDGFTLRYIGYGPVPKSGVRVGDRLYTSPPAPVSMPDKSAVELLATDLMKRIDKITGERHSVATLSSLRVSIVESCCAAMLQGTDGNSPVIPDCSTSAAQFVKDYCKSAGWSEKEFYETQVPMPDITSPSGWAAVSNSPLAIKSHVDLYMRSAPHHEVKK